MRRLRGRSFAVLSTADDDARPHSAGVVYAVATQGAEIYVMTRTHLMKARNIVSNRNVSLVVPLVRRLLWFLPPPSIQFQGTAEVLDRTHPGGKQAFESFFLGRTIMKMYREFERRGETRVCFLRIKPGPVMFAYAVDSPIWQLINRMEGGLVKIEVPAQYRS
jgi:Pyridoxamine 5'-phosphate oxidase